MTGFPAIQAAFVLSWIIYVGIFYTSFLDLCRHCCYFNLHYCVFLPVRQAYRGRRDAGKLQRDFTGLSQAACLFCIEHLFLEKDGSQYLWMEMTDRYANEAESLENLGPLYRTFYILANYDMEMQCGGLCQFFVNPSRDLAPYVEEALETVSAKDHSALYSEFISDNKINVWDLESFKIQSIRQYAEQFARYDFETFDDAYYELPPLYNYLIQWVRDHIDEFALGH